MRRSERWPGRREERGSAGVFTASLGGLAAGAGLMYWLDARSGARRRAKMKQKAAHVVREAEEAVEIATRDLANRSRGLVAQFFSSFRPAQADDEVVAERVRSRLGRLCSHAGAITVASDGGRVQLEGLVLDEELQQVLEGVARVRGVREVVSRLEPHWRGESVPTLQGGGARSGPVPEPLQDRWSPGFRVLAGLAGLGLVSMGRERRTVPAVTAALGGVLLVARAITNRGPGRLFGVASGARGVDVRKAIHVAAPVEQVFAYFTAFENFPRFMTHVRDVHRTGDERWHWIVSGPAGIPLEWDAEITDLVPNQVVAWHSLEGARIESAGVVRFEPEQGGTRLDIRMSYNPPAGVLGHAVAAMLGNDPKRQMDDDLLRFKSLVEKGKATGQRGTVSREELEGNPVPHA